jgi:hypothetical protein
MTIHIEPDLGIPLPAEGTVLTDFAERAAAACATIDFLGIKIDPEEQMSKDTMQTVEDIANDIAAGNPKDIKKLNRKASEIRPAAYGAVNDILREFAIKVVDNAMQIRLVVTNKLLIETANEDPRIRVKALELLGKITDVGLFTERSEVTINHRSTDELRTALRAKIQKLMHSDDIEDVQAVEINGKKVDIGVELGLETPSEAEKTEGLPE